jgi:O-antigen/teichoic acid export membrane protein
MQHSVVRRSLMVSAAFAAGHLFHYALMFSANRLLDPGAFGRFYAAISLLNVLLTPSTVLSFLFAKHFTTVFSTAGVGPVVSELNGLMRRHGTAGLVLVLFSMAVLTLAGSLTGADAFFLLMLVPCAALLVYLFEMARAALQGMLDFFAYSAAWILWRAGQYVVAVAALLFAGAAWAGMAGIFLATVVALLVLLRVIYRRAAAAPVGGDGAWAPFRISAAAPFAFQYGTFILINNVDILLAYLVLSNDQLGAYAASSLLPKAIVTATLPVSQVMLPVMSAWSGAQMRTALLKALGVAAVLSAAGAAVLALGGELACNDRFGIRFCSPWLMAVLALGAIPLSISRVLVVAGLALGTERRTAAAATVVVVGFSALVLIWATSPPALAVIYTACCWLFVVAYGLVMRNGRRMAADPAPEARAQT